MRILVLGGTRFLGRHFVEAALARGHDVTLFNRGKTPQSFGGRVEYRLGNRNAQVDEGLSALESGTWDVVLDTSGYLPAQLETACALLSGRVGQYVFISTISVYADLSKPGLDERAPLQPLGPDAATDPEGQYGALKAACESVVLEHFGRHALIVRPGLITGPFDPTDRFTYYAARFGAPTLLGERGPLAVMAAPPERPVQCIDARDICLWILVALQAHRAGIYNLTSPPGQWSMGSLAEAARHLSVRRGFDVAVRWIDEAALLAAHVTPWTGLPLWIPQHDPEFAGMMEVDVTRALETGLATRPLLDTLADTLEALITHPDAKRFSEVLPGALEDELAHSVA